MSSATSPWTDVVRLACYGARVEVRFRCAESGGELFRRRNEFLPTESTEVDGSRPFDSLVSIFEDEDGDFKFDVDGEDSGPPTDIDAIIDRLDAKIRASIAFFAPDAIFVHAGAVAVDGKAIIIPGSSFSGKSTLVAELVRQGAKYLSDEYAVLDEEGLVHPYARPISVRTAIDGIPAGEIDVAEIGGSVSLEPVPVALIASLKYVAKADWEAEEISAGRGALELLSNTVPARDRPAEALAACRAAAENSLSIKGKRDDVKKAALRLIELVKSLPAS